MLSIEEQKKYKNEALQLFEKANISLTDREKTEELIILEFGDRNFYEFGLFALTFINTDFFGGRYIIFLPNQFCPLHIHPVVDETKGKIEMFRIMYGMVIKYYAKQEDDKILLPLNAVELEKLDYKNHIILNAGEQSMTFREDRHWYRGGPEGGIAMEISTPLRYEQYDIWTDKTSSPKVY